MDVAAQKMAALNKVYADIILNTAKESAARVLAAERRALGFQHQVSAAKEEALGTLLRLKSVMDSKVSPAHDVWNIADSKVIRELETASLGQVIRIQKLEMQLNEAKDIITSLRTELKMVNDEAGILKNNREEQLNKQKMNDHLAYCTYEVQDNGPGSDPVMGSSVGSRCLLTSNTMNGTTEGQYCSTEKGKQMKSLKHSSATRVSVGHPDLASIIMRSKEPEPYKNGCTQRIRAFEQNPTRGKPILKQNDDQLLHQKRESLICENGKNESCSKGPGIANAALYGGKKPTRPEEIVQHASSFKNEQAFKFSCGAVARRKRGTRHRIKSNNSGFLLNKYVMGKGPSDAMSCQTEDTKSCPHFSLRNESLKLSQCSKTIMKGDVMKPNHSDHQIMKSSPSSTECADSGEKVRDILPSSDKNDGQSNGYAQNDVDNIQHVSSLVTHDQKTAEVLSTLQCGGNSETNSSQIEGCVVKDSKQFELRGPAQSGKNRVLKYTFQRKRKRGILSSENDTNALATKRTGDEQNTLLESQKSSIVMESPRSSRRLMQVAHQLISLSERRW